MGWVIIFLTLNFNQFAETVAYGQFNILILFGLTVMTYFLYCRREDYLVGAALALPAMIKLLPGLCAVYFIFAKRCRSLGGFVAGSVITGFLTIWVVGWNNVWFYFSKALWSVNAPELGAANQSWWGFLGRLSTNEVAGDFKSRYPQSLALWGYGGVLLGLTLTIIIIWRVRHGAALNAQLALGALILLSLLISPFSWMHYIVQGFGAILAIIVGLSRKAAKPPLQMLTSLCFVLLAYGGRNDFFAGEIAGLARLSSSYRFFATFTLWLVCLWLLVKPDDNESLELRGNPLSRFKGRANSKQKWIV